MKFVDGFKLLASALPLLGCGPEGFTLLTYNVAGLPEGLSSSRPTQNTPTMSPLLNDYEIVVVQEDFAFHHELVGEIRHEHQAPDLPEPGPEGKIENPSGLARLSRFPIERYYAEAWSACHGTLDNGSDCLAPKGFSVAEHTVDVGGSTIEMDVYNLHMDAGDSAEDEEARAAQVEQLIEALNRRSTNKPVIVAGDTNSAPLLYGSLARLLEGAFLRDACEVLTCPDAGRIDRVLYRGSAFVQLEPERWYVPSGFVDDEGRPLSDHRPVAVVFSLGGGAYYWNGR